MSRAAARRPVMHLVRINVAAKAPVEAAPTCAPAPKKWPRLAAPVDPIETWQRMRAMSAIGGLDFQDGTRKPPLLSAAEARDVLAWYAPRFT